MENKTIGQDHANSAESHRKSVKSDLDILCDNIREIHRQRQDLHRAEKSLTLQIKAKCRRLCRGDKDEADKLYEAMMKGAGDANVLYALITCQPFIEARALIHSQRTETEKAMETAAKKLPDGVLEWVGATKGLGLPGLASIVGEAGNLSNYPTHSKLWKRLGLAVIEGERQQRKKGAASKKHGYSPSRRSVIWTLGNSMFKTGDDYADLYRQRKEVEVAKAEAEGLEVRPSARIPEKDKDRCRSQGHIHNRAKRYMEKCLIRDLWRVWRNHA